MSLEVVIYDLENTYAAPANMSPVDVVRAILTDFWPPFEGIGEVAILDQRGGVKDARSQPAPPTRRSHMYMTRGPSIHLVTRNED